jgi:osmotically-inducible protein OsmY
MKKLTIAILSSLLCVTFLSGCATAIIGGAAVGASTLHDRRTAGTILDDQTIEIKALAKIYKNTELYNSTHINVTAYNGAVLLTGEAPSEALKDEVIYLIRPIPKVTKVYNEISIAAPSGMIARSSDSYITSKAKISLLGIQDIRGFDPTRVKVVTENGTVYLMGLLWPAEVEPVVDAVRRVGGVQRVVKLFEKAK